MNTLYSADNDDTQTLTVNVTTAESEALNKKWSTWTEIACLK